MFTSVCWYSVRISHALMLYFSLQQLAFFRAFPFNVRITVIEETGFTFYSSMPHYSTHWQHLTCDIDPRRRLRSADTATLVVLSTDHSTLGDRAFPVAATRAWNSLPSEMHHCWCHSTATWRLFCSDHPEVQLLSAFLGRLQITWVRCTPSVHKKFFWFRWNLVCR